MDIDFSAAMQPAPGPGPQEIEPDFSAAMTPKKRGRPAKIKPAPLPAPSNSRPDTNIDIYNKDDIELLVKGIYEDSIKENDNSKLKDKLTNQELTFLALYFNSRHEKGKNPFTIDNAMISAGYGGFSKTTRYLLARKIVEKYERAAPGAATIFQKLGFGPVRTVLGVIDHCENSPPTVSLAALRLAAQMQDLVEVKDNPNLGITINLNVGPSPSPGNAPTAPGVVGVFGAPDEDAPAPPPRKPLQITR